eukprot:952278-Pyramimonas_sp.AAC.1
MALLRTSKKTSRQYYPAEELQPAQDDDDGTVPGITTDEKILDRRNLRDLLKSMDVSHITMNFGYCKFLE